MAHLWLESDVDMPGAEGRVGAWRVSPLAAGPATDPGGLPARLLRAPATTGDVWVLLCDTAAVTVNGVPVALGIRVLSDRDVLTTPDVPPVFFSAERLAYVETFAGAARPLTCPRCKDLVESGSTVVRCPQCGVVHHQTDDLPCWTYAEHCALCPQPTALHGAYRWTPEGL